MGTAKYPDENEYSEYIKNKGGYNNAFTSLTETNYHFEVSNEGFEKAGYVRSVFHQPFDG